MRYRHLFFDLDHTLWDFDANARLTLEQLHQELKLQERGVYDFDLFYTNYLAHNDRLWNKYRLGQIKQEELRLKRMWLALLDFKIADEALAREMSKLFLQLLPTRTLLFPHTREVLQYMAFKGYQMHIITNGFEEVQYSKLRSCSIDHFFENVITSEGSNSLKPKPEIYHYAMEKAGAKLAESLMIGDSLDIDIAGANGVGMDSVHVNHLNREKDPAATYTVFHLEELEGLL
ncbi:putative hydrolase of the HAD superfamily [Cnuella takakiae]|uniref:Putative hydrolase of the HAD superfamily n=1 Tax=Cnuella takakiae TaxID=1302690 RepID=A0A1M5IR73_9BACT|nr:YjjG family noncanonical pyrimidine nucleotidase [Cnuella takakiae]OLY93960.1 noncanonical pyrimidine nucleotidase, YjjG family [Cnuella takakiae]SHG30736.1 putative hydrolase of the HAD superfamily [Cnuella takakiae]